MKSLFAWVYISFCVAWKNRRNTPIQNALVYISFIEAKVIFIYLFSVFEERLQRCKFFCNNPKSNGKTSWLFVKGREPRATLTSGLANTRHPSTTLCCKNTCSSWMIMHEFILYSAIVTR